MPDDRETKRRKERLQAISDNLSVARDQADELSAHLLAAKIEDSRVCAEEMIARPSH